MKYETKINSKNRIIRNIIKLGLLSFALLLTLSQSAKAQFSTSIYSTIQTTNQSLWQDMNRYNQIYKEGEKLASDSSTPSSNTGTTYLPPPRQYPITATDFTSSPNRIAPDLFIKSMPNLTNEEKENARNIYNQILTLFETKSRKNNLAGSFALIVGVSLQIVFNKPVSSSDMTYMNTYYNNALANNPQFKNYSACQKQILYESLILTGFLMDALNTKGVMQNDLPSQKQVRELAKSILRDLAGWRNLT